MWQVEANKIKYGFGVIKELGDDVLQFHAKRAVVFTDKYLSSNTETGQHLATALKSLKESNIEVTVYDDVAIEPTDKSFIQAAEFAANGNFDIFISLGGGSVIDTTKAALLYSTYPPRGAADLNTGKLKIGMTEEQFLEYVNAPVGRGIPIPGNLPPHISIPTTAG